MAESVPIDPKKTIVLVLDADTLEPVSVKIQGEDARVDNLKTHPISVASYDTMSAFANYSFFAFKDDKGAVVARYVKRPNCDYLWR